MPVPEFYRFIRPALDMVSDGQPAHVRTIEAKLADLFQLTTDERSEMLPGGSMTRLRNRAYWAVSYLRQAKLVDRVKQGVVQITARGAKYLSAAPTVIKQADLMCFPEFASFLRKNKPGNDSQDTITNNVTVIAQASQATPDEVINAAYKTHRDALAQELLDRIKSMPPAFFERLIVQLMLSLGYGGASSDAGETLGKSGDGGVDGVISQDKLGLDKIYLQAKRWDSTPVGSKELQAFVGALVGQGATKGVFITTSTFTENARKYKDKNPGFKMSLIDGYELARLMIDYDLGVSLEQRFDIKRIDTDFFTDE